MRPALPMHYFGSVLHFKKGRILSCRRDPAWSLPLRPRHATTIPSAPREASVGVAYSGGGAPIGAQVGVFALATRPGAEFGYADFDSFKVE